MAVLEVLKPASQIPIHLVNDRSQAMTTVALRFLANRILELPQAFLPGPATEPPRGVASGKVIAEKVKAVSGFRKIGYACLLGIQAQIAL